MIERSIEYAAIRRAYEGRHARRSGVPYMQHIDEGLAILAAEGADDETQRAFALHPLFQLDDDLAGSFEHLGSVTDSPRVLVLAMEYRRAANQYLSPAQAPPAVLDLGPLPQIALMLRADKIQNYKDFLLYHRDTHPRAAELHAYFQTWFTRLDISREDFASWCERLRSYSQ